MRKIPAKTAANLGQSQSIPDLRNSTTMKTQQEVVEKKPKKKEVPVKPKKEEVSTIKDTNEEAKKTKSSAKSTAPSTVKSGGGILKKEARDGSAKKKRVQI